MLTSLPTLKSQGFSMIELMIGIVIFSLTISMGVSSYRTWIQNTQIRNAAESIRNGLLRTRSEAVKNNTNIFFMLGANSSWIVASGTPPSTFPSDCTSTAFIDCRMSSEGSKNVTRTVLPAAATILTYGNLGTVVANTNGSPSLTQIDLDSSILSAQDSRNLRITIGVGGNVKMCDPNLASGTTGAC